MRQALIEPTDESYEVQRVAAERILHVLMQVGPGNEEALGDL